MLYNFYTVAIASGVAPLIIFMGVGAMTDFGPLLANPKTLLLGAALIWYLRPRARRSRLNRAGFDDFSWCRILVLSAVPMAQPLFMWPAC